MDSAAAEPHKDSLLLLICAVEETGKAERMGTLEAELLWRDNHGDCGHCQKRSSISHDERPT